MLARTLADVQSDAGAFKEAAAWAEKALAGMQGVVGVRVHPLLQPLFDAVIELKKKAGAFFWWLVGRFGLDLDWFFGA
jgi:hypothetical protein